jgi:hypothetical protein
MGSKTPITHALSWFILSVIDFRIGHRRTADWPHHRDEASLAFSLQLPTAIWAYGLLSN